MRKISILAAAFAFAAAPAAVAQTQPATPPVTPDTAQSATPAPTIQRVNVVALEELSEADQARVNEVAAKATDADMQNLRTSIDGNPQASQALQEKGVTSADVLAVAMASDGTLTIVTKKS